MNRSEQRNQIRKKVVEAIILRKEPIAIVARVFNIPQRNIFRWLARYRQGGWHALTENSRKGRPKKVTGEDMKFLYDAVTMGNPLNYKFDFCLWSLNVIRSLLKNERGVELSKSSVCRLMAHLGLTPQRPLYKSYKQDPNAVKNYLDTTYPNALAKAKKYGARLYFVDEAAFRSDAHRGVTWGKCGDTPVVKDTGTRHDFRLISAVSIRGDMHFEVIEKTMNADTFIEFLLKLHSDAKCPILVIADNARLHHAKKVSEFLEKKQGEIMMAFLPAYSPELNPDEQVWNHAKNHIGKQIIQTKDQFVKAILNVMKSIQQQADLIKSFFKLKDTKYASQF